MPNKRDLDKEKLFKKIMPTSAATRGKGASAGAPANSASPPAETSSRTLSAAEIAALFGAAQNGTPVDELNVTNLDTASAAPAASGGSLSPDAIAAMFASAMADPPQAEAPPEEPQAEAPPQEVPAAEPQEAAPAEEPPAAMQPEPPAAPAPEAHTAPDEEASAYPINLAEILIDRYYPQYCARLKGCQCERCRDDVYGMALNRMPPHYIPSHLLQPADLQDRELVSQVVTALVRALFIIKRNPHHNEPGQIAN